MSKWGVNSKAVEARARKDAVKKEAAEKKKQELEDKLWEDNDKHVLRKMERKADSGILISYSSCKNKRFKLIFLILRKEKCREVGKKSRGSEIIRRRNENIKM